MFEYSISELRKVLDLLLPVALDDIPWGMGEMFVDARDNISLALKSLRRIEETHQIMSEGATRFCEWGHWGISFWKQESGEAPQLVVRLHFPVGNDGPIDGAFGSPAHSKYVAACTAWKRDGVIPCESTLDAMVAYFLQA